MSLFSNLVTTPLVLKYVGSLVRHLLTFAAGALVSWGVVKDGGASFVATNQEVIMGIIAYVLSQGLSFAEKKKK